jgi:hypothetical protein
LKDFKITYEEFEQSIKAICDCLDFQDSISEAVYRYNDTSKDDATLFLPTAWIDACINLLEILTDDIENNWIAYWLFEIERGKDYTDGCVTESDGSIIPLKTPKDLWNLLKSE